MPYQSFLKRVAVLALIFIAVVGCHTTTPPSAQSQADALRQAGERLGLPIRASSMASITSGGTTIITAPAANLETVPATELPRGINLAVAYLDGAAPVPRGYYRLRAYADNVRLGTIPGRIELLDGTGRVVGEVLATVEVHSLTVPEEARRQVTQVSIRNREVNCPIRVCYLCTNGHWVCYCAQSLDLEGSATR